MAIIKYAFASRNHLSTNTPVVHLMKYNAAKVLLHNGFGIEVKTIGSTKSYTHNFKMFSLRSDGSVHCSPLLQRQNSVYVAFSTAFTLLIATIHCTRRQLMSRLYSWLFLTDAKNWKTNKTFPFCQRNRANHIHQ